MKKILSTFSILFLFCLISFPSSSATEERRTYFCKNEQGVASVRTGSKINGVWYFNSCGSMTEVSLNEFCLSKKNSNYYNVSICDGIEGYIRPKESLVNSPILKPKF
mgnify:CR=1 FL=1